MEPEKSRNGTEIELKLQVRSQDLPLLRDSPLFARPAVGAGGPRNLESVYFDTADLRLRRKNLTLRVRKQGRQYVQTVKSGGHPHGGAMHRGEWEAPVANAAPDVTAMNGQLGRLRASELKPVFASHIKRT